MARKIVDERFWEKVDKQGEDECWNWIASTRVFGYGQLRIGGENVGAHRFSWELHNGPIPPDKWVLHKCNNAACVNPAHLYLGTPKDNMQDKKRDGRQNLWGRIAPGARGEKNPNAKFTKELVHKLRSEYPGKSQTQLAKENGISRPQVGSIVRREQWKHVE